MNDIPENQWKVIYDISPGFNFTLSEGGDLLLINNNFKDYLGYNGEEHLKINDILEPGSMIYFRVHVQPMIELQEKANEIFLSFKSKAGKSIPVLLNVVRVCENDVIKIHFAGISISKRNQYESEIIQARDEAVKALVENVENVRLKNELNLSQNLIELQLQQIVEFKEQHKQMDKVLSHDLQEPLRKIGLFGSLMKNVDSEVKLNLSKILKSSERLRKLLMRIQQLHAIDYENFKISNVDLKKLLENAKEKLHIQDEKFISLQGELFEFPADPIHLTSLFVELLDNSLKFKRSDVPLEINITTDYFMQNIFSETENKFEYGKFVRILYIDNGIGFENKYANKVFKLFEKLHLNEGLGFGLTYAKRIMNLHKGTISIESKKEKGTEITLLLPLNEKFNKLDSNTHKAL